MASCSDWTRPRREVAWLLRFVQFIRNSKKVRTCRLTIEDYDAATFAISRIVQNSSYSQEVRDFKTKGTVKSSSKIAPLNPEVDAHELLTINGRGQHRLVDPTASRQIILLRSHTNCPVPPSFHRTLGREHVIAKIREYFWIPQARVLACSVLKRYLKSKKLSTRPVTQQMVPLPKARSQHMNLHFRIQVWPFSVLCFSSMAVVRQNVGAVSLPV